MTKELRRRTPEELLREVQAEEDAVRRGRLKVFLGYASGVGKTVRMLDEARRRRLRGQDVVVAATQPRLPEEAYRILEELEVVPSRIVGGRGVIHTEWLRQRHPAVCVVDGLAYDNPSGCLHAHRWQDVVDLLDAGISVIGSINVQYISEVREQVESITGKHVTETVPMSFLNGADEIEIVDAPTVATDSEQRRRQLSKLRELALLLTADVVDRQLSGYLEQHGLQAHFGAQERILVCVTPRANTAEMMRTAGAIAAKFHAELICAYVRQPVISAEDQHRLNEKLKEAVDAGATVEILEGENPVRAILDFARARGITQLFIGHSQRSGWWPRIWGSPVDKLIRQSQGMEVRIFPH